MNDHTIHMANHADSVRCLIYHDQAYTQLSENAKNMAMAALGDISKKLVYMAGYRHCVGCSDLIYGGDKGVSPITDENNNITGYVCYWCAS